MYEKAAELIRSAKRVCAFTGAGISVESGIPPFRGKGGLWNTYDPKFIEIDYFHAHNKRSWILIKEIFYDFFGQARPNAAHKALAELEAKEIVKTVITQNIDNLHQEAGSRNVLEFHGTAHRMICLDCRQAFSADKIDLNHLPPECPNCAVGRLKPDFIFFGEDIPEPACSLSFKEAEISDVFIVIGTTGEVMPACMIPAAASRNGASIIEVNIRPSRFTESVTDAFLQGPATEVMSKLLKTLD
ncbi:MAG: RNA polymerase subunit sigma [Candidatus Riflebacteria bacterium HGW-Riflebacteria-1]|jgi:NAD-dependent deacetylase|nr:MAG: RNA polymerase subunit sigma [Candidatus Riflebacteria bacterium HGW-Riflebacteria-1]